MANPTKQRFLELLKSKYGVPYVDLTAGAEAGRGPIQAQAITVHDSVTGNMTERQAAEFCKKGRRDVPGPLYNVLVGNDVAYVLTLNKSNNTGKCDANRSKLAREGRMPLERQLDRPADDDCSDANTHHLGVAYITRGAGPYTDAQVATMPKVLAALTEACGWSEEGGARSCIKHGEATNRKVDSSLDGGAIRRAVMHARQRGAAVPQPVLHGAIKQKYDSDPNWANVLGKPTTLELPAPDQRGRYNHFERGSIYWAPWTGAWAVYGNIRVAWEKLGWERSTLGYPTSDERTDGNTRMQEFERGSLICDMSTGSVTVTATVI